MSVVIAIFLVLIFLLLLGYGFLAFLAWQKIEIFLTWNTRYDATNYETAITRPKRTKPATAPSITEQKGRQIKPVDDLIDLEDLDIETAMSVVERVGQ